MIKSVEIRNENQNSLNHLITLDRTITQSSSSVYLSICLLIYRLTRLGMYFLNTYLLWTLMNFATKRIATVNNNSSTLQHSTLSALHLDRGTNANGTKIGNQLTAEAAENTLDLLFWWTDRRDSDTLTTLLYYTMDDDHVGREWGGFRERGRVG